MSENILYFFIYRNGLNVVPNPMQRMTITVVVLVIGLMPWLCSNAVVIGNKSTNKITPIVNTRERKQQKEGEDETVNKSGKDMYSPQGNNTLKEEKHVMAINNNNTKAEYEEKATHKVELKDEKSAQEGEGVERQMASSLHAVLREQEDTKTQEGVGKRQELHKQEEGSEDPNDLSSSLTDQLGGSDLQQSMVDTSNQPPDTAPGDNTALENNAPYFTVGNFVYRYCNRAQDHTTLHIKHLQYYGKEYLFTYYRSHILMGERT